MSGAKLLYSKALQRRKQENNGKVLETNDQRYIMKIQQSVFQSESGLAWQSGTRHHQNGTAAKCRKAWSRIFFISAFT